MDYKNKKSNDADRNIIVNPEAIRYIFDCQSCIICEYEKNKVYNLIMDKSADNGFIREKYTKEKSLKDKASGIGINIDVFLEKHGYKDHSLQYSTLGLKNRNKQAKTPFVLEYVKFLLLIDLNARNPPIKFFDLDVFYNVFMQSPKDTRIDLFITRINTFKMNYSKSQMIQVAYVFLFSYYYLEHNNMNRKICSLKLKEYHRIFTTPCSYELPITGDETIDRICIVASKKDNTIDEAIFLNEYYRYYKTKAKMFLEFTKRLISILDTVDDGSFFEFLKTVFTRDTVLYHSIKTYQLFELIIKFYEKTSLPESTVFTIMHKLCTRTKESAVYAMLEDNIRKLDITNILYENYLIVLDLQGISDFGSYEGYWTLHKDRYNVFYFSIVFFSCIYENIQELRYEILELLCKMIDIIPMKFMLSLFNDYFSLLEKLLKDPVEIGSKFLEFNKNHWAIFSKIVLLGQKIIQMEYSKRKKKKKQNTTVKKKERVLWLLLKKIIDIECRAEKMGFDIVRLKKKGIVSKDHVV